MRRWRAHAVVARVVTGMLHYRVRAVVKNRPAPRPDKPDGTLVVIVSNQ